MNDKDNMDKDYEEQKDNKEGDNEMETAIKKNKKLEFMMNEFCKKLSIRNGEGDKIRLDKNDDSDREWFDEDKRMFELRKTGKELKQLLGINQEDINKAIKESRSKWK